MGCTNPNSRNFNPKAIVDDGSCMVTVRGCMDPTAYNYNTLANSDDGSCGWFGCTDPSAINHDPKATLNNGACHYAPVGGTVEYQNFYTSDTRDTNYKNLAKQRSIQPTKRNKIIIRPKSDDRPVGSSPNSTTSGLGRNAQNQNQGGPIRPNTPKSQVRQKISKGQKFVLSTTGEVYKGPYYTFKMKYLPINKSLFGKKVKGNAPLTIPTEFSNTILSYRNGDRTYKDTNQALMSTLPSSYELPTDGGQKCVNCIFNKNNNCSKWNAQIRSQYYCVSWAPKELLISAGDTFRNCYPGITQTGFYTKGNQFLLPNNKFFVGHYHILPNGTYKAENSPTVSFGTFLTLKNSLLGIGNNKKDTFYKNIQSL